MAGDLHVYPEHDAIEHDIETRNCWCRPDIEDAYGGTLVIHHSADGREQHEPDSRPPATRH